MGFLQFGVHFSGCGLASSTACFHVVKEPPKNGFAADDRSVSGDGHCFRCCTVGELLRDCDCVSVRAVQEKCDEKAGRGRATRVGDGITGVGCSAGPLLEKREKGRTRLSGCSFRLPAPRPRLTRSEL